MSVYRKAERWLPSLFLQSLFLPVLFTAAFSGCVSIYTAGPFGYEVLPVPPLGNIPEDRESPVIGESSLHLHLNRASSSLITEDYSRFAQAGIGHTLYLPLGRFHQFIVAASGSGWYGEASFERERKAATSRNLIPGTYAFYGTSGQGSAFYRFGSKVALRLGISTLISWEGGDYYSFRKEVAAIPREETDEWYVNLSPTPWSHNYLTQIGLDFRLPEDTVVLFYIDGGVGFPELGAEEEKYIPLSGYTLLVRQRRISVYGSHRIMSLLNNSINVGIIFHLF